MGSTLLCSKVRQLQAPEEVRSAQLFFGPKCFQVGLAEWCLLLAGWDGQSVPIAALPLLHGEEPQKDIYMNIFTIYLYCKLLFMQALKETCSSLCFSTVFHYFQSLLKPIGSRQRGPSVPPTTLVRPGAAPGSSERPGEVWTRP